MPKSRRWNPIHSTLLLLASAVVLGGCEPIGHHDILAKRFKCALQGISISGGLGKKRGRIQDRYFSFRSKRGRTSGSFRPRHEASAPFRVEARLGVFNAKRADWGKGSFGITLHDAAGDAGPERSIRVRRSGEGLEVFVPGGIGGPEVSRLVPDQQQILIAIEHDGADVVFSTRGEFEFEFIELARIPTSFQGPFEGSLEVVDLEPGGEVGIDNVLFTIPERTDLGTARQRALNHLERSRLSLLEALGAVDGLNEQPNTVRIGVGEALFRLDEARKELTSGVAGKKASKPVRLIAAALKQTFKATDTLSQSVPSVKAAKSIQKAYVKTVKALNALN